MSTATDDAFPSTAIAAFSGLSTLAALAYVTVLLFDDLFVGIVVGCFSGVGTALFVPYVMALQDPDQKGDADGRGAGGRDGSRIHRGAVGAALSGSAIAILAVMFVLEDALLAVAAGLALAAVEYVFWSLVLPRA